MAKKIAACLTFDFDAISLWLGGFHASSLSAISRGEFGRVGALRLLAMLREWKIPSTWFVPGHSAETYPEIAKRIASDGHEIGNHGYFHSHPKSPEDEERILVRGNEVLQRMTGKRPIGFREPAAQARISLRLESDGRRLHTALYAGRRQGARRRAI